VGGYVAMTPEKNKQPIKPTAEGFSSERIEYLKSRACQFCFRNYAVTGYTACHTCLYGNAERLPQEIIDSLSQPSTKSMTACDGGKQQLGSEVREKSGSLVVDYNWLKRRINQQFNKYSAEERASCTCDDGYCMIAKRAYPTIKNHSPLCWCSCHKKETEHSDEKARRTTEE
jgi:hypothetical protein